MSRCPLREKTRDAMYLRADGEKRERRLGWIRTEREESKGDYRLAGQESLDSLAENLVIRYKAGLHS